MDNDTLQRKFQSADNVALALDREMRIEKVRENIYIYIYIYIESNLNLLLVKL